MSVNGRKEGCFCSLRFFQVRGCVLLATRTPPGTFFTLFLLCFLLIFLFDSLLLGLSMLLCLQQARDRHCFCLPSAARAEGAPHPVFSHELLVTAWERDKTWPWRSIRADCFGFPYHRCSSVSSSQPERSSLGFSHLGSLLKRWLGTRMPSVNRLASRASRACCSCRRLSSCKKKEKKKVRRGVGWLCCRRGEQRWGSLTTSLISLQVVQLVCQECWLSTRRLQPDANSIYLNRFR